MARHLTLRSARQEMHSAHVRHKDMLGNIRRHSLDNNKGKDSFLYLMAIPVIYAAWEGYFRLACSICLKTQCFIEKKAKKYHNKYTALWLQRESFFDSFLQNLFNSMQMGRSSKKISSGKFMAVSSFAGKIGPWLESPINHLSNFDELVMTHSNVNKDVAKLNSDIIGLHVEDIDFSRLDELVNRRNEIAHGGLINYPTENNVVELLDYTENLIDEFHLSIEDWLTTS